MKKLCAKQNRRAKQWAKIENFANTSQCVRNLCEFRKAIANLAMVANLAMWFAKLAKWLRVWQGDCEFGKVVCEFGKVVCEFGKVFTNLAKWFAKLAMRNFAKLLKFYVRSKVRK